MNEEKARLVEILSEIDYIFADGKRNTLDTMEYVADFLLAKGVVFPPCKVGQEVYLILPFRYEGEPELYQSVYVIQREKIDEMTYFEDGEILFSTRAKEFKLKDIGKSVCLTEQEAEKSQLKGGIW